MMDTSPLQRAAEQPPCNSEAEALALNGMFAVPARMARFDLGPHLWFPEHRTIWAAMCRVVDGEPDGFWWRTFKELQRELTAEQCWRLLGVLEHAPFMMLDDSDDGCLLFMLAFKKIERCTLARCEIADKQYEVTQLWRVPNTPYSIEDKRRMLRPSGPVPIRLALPASSTPDTSVDDLDV